MPTGSIVADRVQGDSMLKVWGKARGFCVKKVLWCLDELGMEFERSDTGYQRQLPDCAGSMQMNDNDRAPMLQDGEVTLSGSNAIMRYLALQRGDEGLYPLQPKEHGEVNRWLDWSMCAMWPDIATVYMQWIRTRAADRDHRRLAAASRNLERNWAIVDEYLGKKGFIASDRFTIADIALGVFAEAWVSIELEGKPALRNFNDWYDRMEKRSGFRTYVALPSEPDVHLVYTSAVMPGVQHGQNVVTHAALH
jgi:glutathione S-transferase